MSGIGPTINGFIADALSAKIAPAFMRGNFVAMKGRAPLVFAYKTLAGVWRSLVARRVRDAEVAGSNPVTPTKKKT